MFVSIWVPPLVKFDGQEKSSADTRLLSIVSRRVETHGLVEPSSTWRGEGRGVSRDGSKHPIHFSTKRIPVQRCPLTAAHEGLGSGGSRGGLFFALLPLPDGLFEQLLGLLSPLPSENPDIAALQVLEHFKEVLYLL